MDIDYNGLMFPAIPLMMTMYSNRFHTLSALIRQIHDQYTFEKKFLRMGESTSCFKQKNKFTKICNGICRLSDFFLICPQF